MKYQACFICVLLLGCSEVLATGVFKLNHACLVFLICLQLYF